MNKNNYKLELLTGQLAMVLESLEEYIRLANKDLVSKEQFYSRTASVYKISSEVAESGFFSQFSVASTLFFNVEEYRNSCRETQKEFYKWVDHSGITTENCPEKLKHFLNEINEALENGNSKLYQAYQTVIKEEKLKIKPLKKSPFFYQACKEVDKELGFTGFGELPISKAKNYKLKIEGNAERGQQTFQQIKNSIVSQPEWTFPINGEKYVRKIEKKIKELEAKKVQSQPKEPQRNELILITFEDVLRDVEIYISKLNYYPNWKVSEWNGEGEEDYTLKKYKDKSAEEIIEDGMLRINLKMLSQVLRFLKRDDPNYYSNLINELKIKFFQWQSERKIELHNCPYDLKQLLLEINQILESNWNWRKNKDGKENNESKQDEQEKIAEIIVEIKLKVIELATKYKITELGSQLDNWEDKIKQSKSVSEAESISRQIEKKLQEEKLKHQPSSATTDKNKLSLSTKIALGFGITGLVLGITFITYWVIKNKKSKK